MKKVRYILAAFMVAAVAAVVFVGCKKDKETETASTEKGNSYSGILCFSTPEEFSETRHKVLAMTETERREWEKQQGFKSYATKCYELFEAFEAKGINSDQDIYDFVKENSDYFYIREEEGELYLSNYLEESPYFYFANEEQLIQMGKDAMKIFQEGVATCNADKKHLLLKCSSYLDSNLFTEISFFPNERKEFLPINNIIYKDFSNEKKTVEDKVWCDANEWDLISYIGQRVTTWFIYSEANRNVTKVYYQRYLHSTQTVSNVAIPIYHWEIVGLVKPYHRVAGIWFGCSRTMTYNLKTEWIYDNIPIGDGIDNSTELGGISGTSRTFLYRDYSSKPIEFKIKSFHGWSKTPDTPQINM